MNVLKLVLLNKIYKRFTFLCLLTILLLYNCNGSSSWSQDKIDNLIVQCINDGKNKLDDELKLKDICECSIEKFTSEFSWKEYQEMQVQDIVNIDLNSRLNLIIELITKECEVFYDSSISFK